MHCRFLPIYQNKTSKCPINDSKNVKKISFEIQNKNFILFFLKQKKSCVFYFLLNQLKDGYSNAATNNENI